MDLDHALHIVANAEDDDPRLPEALAFLSPPCQALSMAGRR